MHVQCTAWVWTSAICLCTKNIVVVMWPHKVQLSVQHVCCYPLVSHTVVFVSFCWGGALRVKTREITVGTSILKWANEKWHNYQVKTSHSKKTLPCHLYHRQLTTGRTLVYRHVLFVSLHVPSTNNACTYTSTM